MFKSVALVICAFTAAVPVVTDMVDALVTGAFTVNAPVDELVDNDMLAALVTAAFMVNAELRDKGPCCAPIGPLTVIPVGALTESGTAVVRLAPELMVNELLELIETLDEPAVMGEVTLSAPLELNELGPGVMRLESSASVSDNAPATSPPRVNSRQEVAVCAEIPPVRALIGALIFMASAVSEAPVLVTGAAIVSVAPVPVALAPKKPPGPGRPVCLLIFAVLGGALPVPWSRRVMVPAPPLVMIAPPTVTPPVVPPLLSPPCNVTLSGSACTRVPSELTFDVADMLPVGSMTTLLAACTVRLVVPTKRVGVVDTRLMSGALIVMLPGWAPASAPTLVVVRSTLLPPSSGGLMRSARTRELSPRVENWGGRVLWVGVEPKSTTGSFGWRSQVPL